MERHHMGPQPARPQPDVLRPRLPCTASTEQSCRVSAQLGASSSVGTCEVNLLWYHWLTNPLMAESIFFSDRGAVVYMRQLGQSNCKSTLNAILPHVSLEHL